MANWLLYKYDDESFHTTKLCSRLYLWNWIVSQKIEKSVFQPNFRGLRDNVHTPPIARWKALLDFLFVIIEFFAISYGCYKWRSVEVGIFRRGWVTLRLNFIWSFIAYEMLVCFYYNCQDNRGNEIKPINCNKSWAEHYNEQCRFTSR